jgi:DNA ligase (NAD+)
MFDKKALIKLLDDIDLYDDAYYNDNKQLVSDQIYDGFKDHLRSMGKLFKPGTSKADEKLSIRLQDALTRVGAPPPKDGKWPKYTHEQLMSSLNKVNLPSELETWHKKCGSSKKLLMTEKLDGISISLKYENGSLVAAATRGNSEIGENITRNVLKMQCVPNKLSNDFTGHIRGEIVLLRSDWKKYIPEMDNPRNGASGVAKRIDGKDVQYLTVITYTVDGKDFKTESESFEWMKALGFRVPNYSIGTLEDANKLWQKYMDETRATLDYDIDGLVIRVNDMAQQLSFGEENHRPKGAIAFKFEAPEAKTIIRNIVCQVGDTGRITPVAEFDEVQLLGAKIERASIHNFSLVKELGVNIGAEVIIERNNDVIPGLKEVITPCNGYFKAPETCPACGTETKKVGEYLVCPNKKECPPQIIGRLNKWVKELGILEWGESILTKLIAAGKVIDVADLYLLKADDIKAMDRMGDKGAANLLTELDKYRAVTLENFLGGLCIDGIATSTVKSVIDEGHDTLDKICALSKNQLENVPGFAEKRAAAFYDGLKENADRITSILKAGVTIKQRTVGSLTGSKIAFTGTMSTPRKLLQKMVEDAGGEVDKSVGKQTKILVIDDVNSTSSKAQAARKLGTRLVSEAEFIAMVG